MSSKLQAQITLTAKDNASPAFHALAKESDVLQTKLATLSSGFGGLKAALNPAMLGGIMGGFSFASVIKSAADFETALWQTTKVTDESVDSIKKKMMELPSELGSATELTTGYYQVMSAGITDAIKAQEMLVVASQTAKASGISQAEAINALAKVMNGYEDGIKDASQAANMLFTIEKLGMTSVRELAPLMGDLSGVAKALGVDYTELAGSMALVTQTSGSTSTAATRLNSLFMELMRPTTNLQKALAAVGASSVEGLIKTEGWTGTLRKIEEGAKKTGQSLSVVFGSSEAYQGFIKLMKDSFSFVDQYSKEIAQTTDALSGAFGRYTETVNGQFDNLKNGSENLAIKLGESLGGSTSAALGTFADGLSLLNKHFDSVANGAVIFSGALASLIAVKKMAGAQSFALAAEDAKLHGVTTMLIDRTLGLDAAMQKRMVTQQALSNANVRAAQNVVASAQAELRVAQSATASAQAELALTRAKVSAAVTTRQVTAASIAERNALIALDTAQLKVAAKSNALATAQANLAISMTAASGAISRTAVAGKALGASLLSAFGGPVGLGVTALTSGLLYLTMRENEAEEAARSLRIAQEANAAVAKTLTEAQGEYNQKLSDSIVLMQEIAVEKAQTAMHDALNAIRGELENFTEETRAGVFGGNITASLFKADLQGLTTTIEAIQAGKANAADFTAELTKLIRHLESTGQTGTALYPVLRSLFSDDFASSLESAQQELDSAKNVLQGINTTSETAASGIASTGNAAERTAEQIADLTAAMQAMQNNGTSFDLSTMDGATRYIMSITKNTQLAVEAQKELQRVSIKTARQTLQNGILDAQKRGDNVSAQNTKTLYGQLDARLYQLDNGILANSNGVPQIDNTAKSISNLEREIQRLSLSKEAFREWDLTNRILPELMQKTAGATTIVQDFATAQREAWVKEDNENAQAKALQNLNEQVDLYDKLANLSGDYTLATAQRAHSIELEADALRAAHPELATYVDEWERLSKAKNVDEGKKQKRAAPWEQEKQRLEGDDYYDDPFAGMKLSMLDYGQDAFALRDQMRDSFTGMFGTIESAGTQAFKTLFTGGKFEVDSFFANLSARLAEQAAEAASNQLMKGILGMIGNAAASGLGGMFSSTPSMQSMASTSMDNLAGMGITASTYYHSGGVVQRGGTTFVPSALFANAPTFHGGGFLAPDEVPIIAQTGETVLSRSESGNLGAKLDHIATLLSSQQTQPTTTGGNTSVVLVDDQRKVKNYLLSPEGGKTFVSVLNQHRQSIKNIANGGRG